MKIRIAQDIHHRFTMSQPGRTMAEKMGHVRAAEKNVSRWMDVMLATQGTWVDVETQFLFAEQFNTKDLRVMSRYIDGIDFGPEFSGLEEFYDACQVQYDKNWPGMKVPRVLEVRINTNQIEDLTNLHRARNGTSSARTDTNEQDLCLRDSVDRAASLSDFADALDRSEEQEASWNSLAY